MNDQPDRALAGSVLVRCSHDGAHPSVAAKPSSRRSARPSASTTTGRAVIERAHPADAPAILAVESAIFSDPEGRFNARQIRGLIANPRAAVAVARHEGATVGWCVSLTRSHARWRSGRIYSIAVMHEFAGRGIGRALLQWSLAELAAQGVGRVYLEVREYNAPAIALYRDVGFETVERLASYYAPGIDGLRMLRIADTRTNA